VLPPDHQQHGPEKRTFYAVTSEGVEAVAIFLDSRLESMLGLREKTAWQGLIEYIQEDIST
jgi:hypothetical protein